MHDAGIIPLCPHVISETTRRILTEFETDDTPPIQGMGRI
jgi:hypothetical protein